VPDWYLGGGSASAGSKREVVRMYENRSRRGPCLRWVVEYPAPQGYKKARSSFAYRHDAEEFYRSLIRGDGGLSRSRSSHDPGAVAVFLPDWRL
jgi:hypothetical protein